jgi:hypothetical protein
LRHIALLMSGAVRRMGGRSMRALVGVLRPARGAHGVNYQMGLILVLTELAVHSPNADGSSLEQGIIGGKWKDLAHSAYQQKKKRHIQLFL